MACNNKRNITPIATALGTKQEQELKPTQPIRRDYSGLPKTGYVRIRQLARNPKKPEAPAPIPVSPVTIWRWVAAGTFPAPIKLSGGVTARRAEDQQVRADLADILNLVYRLADEGQIQGVSQ